MTETNRVMDLKEQIKRELESLKVGTMAEIDEFTETFEGLSSGLHEAMDTSKTREAHKAADAGLLHGSASMGNEPDLLFAR